MDNQRRFKSFNTSSNSHINLNTNMPMPPPPKLNPQLPRTRFVSGSYNRVPPPPTMGNNR